VDIIMAYENMDGALIDAAPRPAPKGIVIAGVGNGNLTAAGRQSACGAGEEGHRRGPINARGHGNVRPQRRAG
jgi:L-asparaginase/Glu-tRNA(Gln) amidotransferase subunit D